jgi:NADH dehydrogenase
VLITGANGFIARRLAPELHSAGLRVEGASRSGAADRRVRPEPGPGGGAHDTSRGSAPESTPIARRDVAQPVSSAFGGPDCPPGFAGVHRASLGESLAPVLAAADHVAAIVHTALASGAGSYEANTAGTLRWLREGREAGVRLQIFLSTLSAGPDALSDYGRSKYNVGQAFVEAGQVVFRLGVVVGNGGMFGKMVESARRSPLIPLLDGGNQPVYVHDAATLMHILRDTVLAGGEGLRGRVWNLQQPEPYPLRQVLAAICKAYGLRRAFVPVPSWAMLAAVRAAEAMPAIHLPVKSANVRGLLQQGRETHPSDYPRFGYSAEPLETLVARAVLESQ